LKLIIRESMVRAHLGPLNNQPLTIYFAGGFLVVASLLPGLEGKVGGNYYLSWFYSGEDSIEDTVLIEGVTFRFIDTAGIRETADTIKNLGVRRTSQRKPNEILGYV
jgi:hypothetical protein